MMGKYVVRKTVAGGEEINAISPVAGPYWITIARPGLKKEVPFAVEREIQTLVKCLDLMALGQVAELADVLMARYQAVETSMGFGWRVAQHLEELPRAQISSVPEDMQEKIVRHEARDLRTRELQQKTSRAVA
jgi:hypothetical protein